MRPIIKHGIIGVGTGIAMYLLMKKHCSANPSQVSGLASGFSGGGAVGGSAAIPDLSTSTDAANTPPPGSCPAGQVLLNGVCQPAVVTSPGTCPDGYSLGPDGQCQPNSCPTGYSIQNGQCVANTPTCPAGYTLGGDGTCILIDTTQNTTQPTRTFPTGSTGRTIKACPTGEVWDVNKPGGPGCVRKASSTTTTRGAGSRPTATAIMADGKEPVHPDYSLMDDLTRNFMIGFGPRMN